MTRFFFFFFFFVLMLAGCGERASTYDQDSGHYVSTDQYKHDHHVDQVCQTASCWDDKSGHFH